MKQIFRLITCMAVCFLTCGLSSCDNQKSAQGSNENTETTQTVESLSKRIEEIKADVSKLQEESGSAHTIAWIIAVALVLVWVGTLFLVFKRVSGLDKTDGKLRLKVDELDKKLVSLEDKVQQTKSKAVSKTGTVLSAESAIPNLQESFESLSRRLQQLEQKLETAVKQLQVQSVAPPVSQVQQAAPVVSKFNRHGYFKIPIKGAEGAYFDQVAEEKSGAYFDVEYTDNSATFKPIAPYTQLNQLDNILDHAVELQGDQDNSQNYDCLIPGRAHLQGGRWVIDAKAKLKLY